MSLAAWSAGPAEALRVTVMPTTIDLNEGQLVR